MKEKKRAVGAVVGVLAAVALMAFQPFAGLSSQGTVILSLMIGAIVWWITDVLSDFITAIIMATLFVVLADVPVEIAFSACTTSVWWLVISAFCLGCGMQRCGLMERMARAVLRVFPRSFRAQAAGLMLAGVVAGPFIPSVSAKAAMMTPLALNISDRMGYERKGRQANGLFLATFVGIRSISPAVISASFLGYVVLGLLPEQTQQQFDMAHWFLAALPWFAVVLVMSYVTLVWLYEPKGKCRKDASTDVPKEKALALEPTDGENLGPMSAGEKKALVIMLATVIMWVFESWHGVPAFAVALLAVAAMTACGILGKRDFVEGVAWDGIVFMGIVLGLSAVFQYAGIDGWIVNLCGPLVSSLASNPYALVLGVGCIVIAFRFLIVSETALLNIFMAFMIPITVPLGINAWIVGFSMYAVVSPWFTVYQNFMYMTAIGSVGDLMTDHGVVARYCAVYLAICLLGLVVSVPYWQWLGLV